MPASVSKKKSRPNNKNKLFWIVCGAVTCVLAAAAFCIPLGVSLARNVDTTTTMSTATAATSIVTTTITTVATTTTGVVTTTTSGCSQLTTATLLLSDTSTAKVQTLINGLQSANLTVNYMPGGISNYSGTPTASCYGSVLLIPGNFLTIDMPITGQQSILNAQQNSGTGVVITELVAAQVHSGKLTTLSPLLLGSWLSGTLAIMSYTLVSSGHPIWNGLPTSFTTNVTLAYSLLGSVTSGSIIIANCTSCSSTPGVIVRSQSGTTGRIVQINHAGHYGFSPFNWGNDANLLPMMTNAAQWAAQLI